MRKSAPFKWTSSCQATFDQLRSRLVTAPVLAYHDFKRDFILETDVSISAILSQIQEDGKVHPVAYASRALSSTEKNYAITELETLAVVWQSFISGITCMVTMRGFSQTTQQ